MGDDAFFSFSGDYLHVALHTGAVHIGVGDGPSPDAQVCDGPKQHFTLNNTPISIREAAGRTVRIMFLRSWMLLESD